MTQTALAMNRTKGRADYVAKKWHMSSREQSRRVQIVPAPAGIGVTIP